MDSEAPSSYCDDYDYVVSASSGPCTGLLSPQQFSRFASSAAAGDTQHDHVVNVPSLFSDSTPHRMPFLVSTPTGDAPQQPQPLLPHQSEAQSTRPQAPLPTSPQALYNMVAAVQAENAEVDTTLLSLSRENQRLVDEIKERKAEEESESARATLLLEELKELALCNDAEEAVLGALRDMLADRLQEVNALRVTVEEDQQRLLLPNTMGTGVEGSDSIESDSRIGDEVTERCTTSSCADATPLKGGEETQHSSRVARHCLPVQPWCSAEELQAVMSALLEKLLYATAQRKGQARSHVDGHGERQQQQESLEDAAPDAASCDEEAVERDAGSEETQNSVSIGNHATTVSDPYATATVDSDVAAARSAQEVAAERNPASNSGMARGVGNTDATNHSSAASCFTVGVLEGRKRPRVSFATAAELESVTPVPGTNANKRVPFWMLANQQRPHSQPQQLSNAKSDVSSDCTTRLFARAQSLESFSNQDKAKVVRREESDEGDASNADEGIDECQVSIEVDSLKADFFSPPCSHGDVDFEEKDELFSEDMPAAAATGWNNTIPTITANGPTNAEQRTRTVENTACAILDEERAADAALDTGSRCLVNFSCREKTASDSSVCDRPHWQQQKTQQAEVPQPALAAESHAEMRVTTRASVMRGRLRQRPRTTWQLFSKGTSQAK